MIRAVVRDVVAGQGRTSICARFHATIMDMFAEAARATARSTGIDRVVLSGGCMNNTLLRRGLQEKLTRDGLEVGLHRRVPCGDAGLSLGQTVIASAAAESGLRHDGG